MSFLSSLIIHAYTAKGGTPPPPTQCRLITAQGTYIITAQGNNIVVNCQESDLDFVVDNFGNFVVDESGNRIVALIE